MDDPRFKRVATDPRFKVIPKRSRKVQIDSRFQSMFTDKRFKVKYEVDRKGRKVKETSSEDLRKYYHIEDEQDSHGKSPRAASDRDVPDEEEDNESNEDAPSDNEPNEVALGDNSDNEDAPSVSSDNEEDPGSDTSTDLDEYTFNGEGLGEQVIHSWGEEGEVDHSEATSKRLAVCNIDWDRVGASDLYVLLNSFTPSGGVVTMVTVYPSDYGLECMSHEDRDGPRDLIEDSEGAESTEGRGYSMEKLRQYQLKRLKYYYAVVECDSVATAEHIYGQCDGLEYEQSGGHLDLRFIPDEMKFDDREAKSVATERSVTSSYTPVNFTSSALQQSKVHLTWDETDPKRLQTTMRKFTKDDLQSMDFSAYLGGSSDSEEEGGVTRDEDGCGLDDRIQKYRALVEDLQGSKSQDESGEEMEITWEPGLKESAQELVKRKQAEKDEGGLTTWERYLKEKKRKKKKEIKETDDDGGHLAPEDNLGFDDPFFQHDVTKTTARSKKTKKSKVSEEEKDELQKDKNELELLVMDSDEDKQHFNLKAIMKGEKEEKRKRRKRKKRGEEEAPADTFEVDVNDPRFEALYSSHHYAPDPANPQYKSTKAMAAIMSELGRRRKQRKTDKGKEHSKLSDPSLGLLVKSVKMKASAFSEHRKKSRAKQKQSK